MPEMFSRLRARHFLGLILLVVLPATGLAQSEKPATPTTTTTNQAKPADQADKATTPEKQTDKQTPAAQPTKAKLAKGKFNLKVGSSPIKAIDLKANEALAAEIAARLSKEFDIPILLSPVMQKAHISVEFEGMPLEGAARMIAPQPYADYEISGDGSTMTKLVALYLYALNEPPPSESAVVRGDSEAILISGDTEEGTERASKEEASLTVKLERNQFTVHARKQPLSAVLYEIATKVDIPFEMKYDSSEVVNVDLNNATMEQVVRTLSPNIRLYQRTDLQTYETRPLRLVLAQPTSQTIKM